MGVMLRTQTPCSLCTTALKNTLCRIIKPWRELVHVRIYKPKDLQDLWSTPDCNLSFRTRNAQTELYMSRLQSSKTANRKKELGMKKARAELTATTDASSPSKSTTRRLRGMRLKLPWLPGRWNTIDLVKTVNPRTITVDMFHRSFRLYAEAGQN